MRRWRWRSLFEPRDGLRDRLIARWLFLRALGAIYFSAFYALLFQVRGLIGEQGILPAADYLNQLRPLGGVHVWYAPTLLWFSAGDGMLKTIFWVGLTASLLVVLNLWPRLTLGACFVCFVSFVSVAQDFSGYQSDGMLLEAGFLALFLAPGGKTWRQRLWPGWGADSPPLRAAVGLLLWEWLRIYFESGIVKLNSGDPTWRNLTALYEYYQNGPLPTWIGWYVQHLPHWFHLGTAALTLIMELLLVWLVFCGRRARLVCCAVVTAWQIGVIATANYAFLNYLVLVLAVLLLDDRQLIHVVPVRWRAGLLTAPGPEPPLFEPRWTLAAGFNAFVLCWICYATLVPLGEMLLPRIPLPAAPCEALSTLRIANGYGLFAVMTPHRYEIEFQGSNDGEHWSAYPFRYKPQKVDERPGIYAPYQPRFDWNLWFASLGSWHSNLFVPRTEELLLGNDAAVLTLFGGNPFPRTPPKYVRAVLWQYWFSTPEEKAASGAWWRRQWLGTYAPTLTKLGNGQFAEVEPATLDAGMPGS